MMKASLTNIWKLFSFWCEISRQRRDLREYGAVICKDIGVSRATLDFETKRLLWKEKTETPDSFQRS